MGSIETRKAVQGGFTIQRMVQDDAPLRHRRSGSLSACGAAGNAFGSEIDERIDAGISRYSSAQDTVVRQNALHHRPRQWAFVYQRRRSRDCYGAVPVNGAGETSFTAAQNPSSISSRMRRALRNSHVITFQVRIVCGVHSVMVKALLP